MVPSNLTHPAILSAGIIIFTRLINRIFCAIITENENPAAHGSVYLQENLRGKKSQRFNQLKKKFHEMMTLQHIWKQMKLFNTLKGNQRNPSCVCATSSSCPLPLNHRAKSLFLSTLGSVELQHFPNTQFLWMRSRGSGWPPTHTGFPFPPFAAASPSISSQLGRVSDKHYLTFGGTTFFCSP